MCLSVVSYLAILCGLSAPFFIEKWFYCAFKFDTPAIALSVEIFFFFAMQFSQPQKLVMENNVKTTQLTSKIK